MVIVYVALVFLVGLVAGFGINVAATRLAAGKPFLGPLGCTRSAHPLHLRQALPVVGYLAQRGRCSTCGAHLSAAFPLTELVTAGLFAGLFILEGFGAPFAFHAFYVVMLMLVLVIDWKHRDIYFSTIALGSGVALLGSAVLPQANVVNALIGAGVAAGFFLLAYVLARVIFPKIEEPLGAGDVLLALMMGLMLGFPNIVGALLIGPLLAGAAAAALLVSRRSKPGDFMPYGVALCAATILFLVYPSPFVTALKLPALMVVLSGFFG